MKIHSVSECVIWERILETLLMLPTHIFLGNFTVCDDWVFNSECLCVCMCAGGCTVPEIKFIATPLLQFYPSEGLSCPVYIAIRENHLFPAEGAPLSLKITEFISLQELS